jgi:hypothetical protein
MKTGHAAWISVAMWAPKGNLKLRGLQEHNHLGMLFLYGRETFWLASLENIRKWLLLLVVYSSAAFANTSLTAQEFTRIDINIFILAVLEQSRHTVFTKQPFSSCHQIRMRPVHRMHSLETQFSQLSVIGPFMTLQDTSPAAAQQSRSSSASAFASCTSARTATDTSSAK